jgi:hypothetical protein
MKTNQKTKSTATKAFSRESAARSLRARIRSSLTETQLQYLSVYLDIAGGMQAKWLESRIEDERYFFRADLWGVSAGSAIPWFRAIPRKWSGKRLNYAASRKHCSRKSMPPRTAPQAPARALCPHPLGRRPSRGPTFIPRSPSNQLPLPDLRPMSASPLVSFTSLVAIQRSSCRSAFAGFPSPC